MSIMISEKNLILHEFIGLRTSIIDSPCKSLVDVSGTIVDETMNTFKIEFFTKGTQKIITVPKHKTRFRIKLPINREQANRDTVDLDGSIITKRPEDRIKKLTKLAKKLENNRR